MNSIYKITVTNWIHHNPNKKNTHKKTLIANNMIYDARICALPLSNKWLFLGLLLICGDYANDTVTLTERQINELLTTREGARNALDRLQSFQLLSYEKIELLNNRNEIKEKNRIEIKEINKEKSLNELLETKNSKNDDVIKTHALMEIWNEAKNLSKARLNNKTRNAKIEKVWNKLSPDEWREVVKRMDASDFLTGKITGKDGRSFKADFDFFIQPETYIKVMEGKYDNRKSNKGASGYLRDGETVGAEFDQLLDDIRTGRAYENGAAK